MTGVLDVAHRRRRFRVLALDGGGVKGAFSASVLATLEAMNPGVRLADYFELICGTSTGGILALGLGLGCTAGELVKFYREYGAEIFPVTGVERDVFRSLFQVFCGPKYSTLPLRRALTRVFSNRLLGHSTRPLVIPSYDATMGDIKLFKTAHDPRLKQDYLCRAVDVALGTSAAPTYFAAATTERHDVHIDGGTWANAPIVVGLLEAHVVFDQPLETIDLLSIGTTDAPFNMTALQTRRGALWSWRRLTRLSMQAQMAGALAQGRLMIGERLLRVNPLVTPARFRMDGARSLNELCNLGESAARHSEQAIRDRFIAPGPAALFVPCYQVPQ